MIEQTKSARCSTERLLLDELAHRVDNEFAAAICIASLAAERAATETARADFYLIQRRLESFARVHRLLHMPARSARIDACAYLRQLCGAIDASKLQPHGIELVFVGRALHLRSEQCWRLGMIVSELITNAASHGFDQGPGQIRVETSCRDDAVQCHVQDNGTGSARNPRGRGLEIVEALVDELGGRFVQRFSMSGSAATLVFPIIAQSSLEMTGARSPQAAAYPPNL